MAEVIVTLSLKRKTGILAAAISSLARNDLECKTHRFLGEDDDSGLRVELVSEGEVGDPHALSDALARIRSVDTVVGIEEDGQSLLDAEATQAPDLSDSESLSAFTRTADASEVVAEPEPETEPKPKPKPEPKPAARPVPDQSRKPENQDDESDIGDMRPSMKRRRRRRR